MAIAQIGVQRARQQWDAAFAGADFLCVSVGFFRWPADIKTNWENHWPKRQD